MVLYSIIKPNICFFCDKSSYYTARFHMNDQLSGVRNPGKVLKYTFQTVFYVVAMTSHRQQVAQKFYKRKQNAFINVYTLNK